MTDQPGTSTPPSRPAGSPPPTIRAADVVYALFRHKWLALTLSLLGVLGAGALYLTQKPLYTSEAKLLVRYVRDTKAADAAPGAVQTDLKSPDSRGDAILNSEMEILTSRDLATQVAELIGPEQILGADPAATNVHAAAYVIMRGLQLEVPRRSTVIQVKFSHSNPEVAQKVLRQLIQSYLRKHAEVHRSVGLFDDVLTRKTDEWRSRLSQTEDDLQKIKLNANVTSVDESRRAIAEQSAKLQQDLIAAEAELAQRRTFLERLLKSSLAAAPAATNAEAAVEIPVPVDPEKEKQYRFVCARLESLRNRELDLALQFTPESKPVVQIRDQIAEVEKTKTQLEAEEPRLRATALVQGGMKLQSDRVLSAQGQATTLEAEQAQVVGLESKIKILTEHLNRNQKELATLIAAEKSINDLEHSRALQETNYRYFSVRLDQARVDEAIGTANLFDNINIVQDATVALRAPSPMLKAALMVLLGGIGAGLALPFLIEFMLNQTLKRPDDVEKKLRLPLFLSIPDFTRNGHARHSGFKQLADAPTTAAADAPAPGQVESDTALAVVDPDDPIRLYHESLRDRLIMHFELIGLTHKPKLVALTGTHRGAGVSTLAAGLAESLSETGDGNVLLVNMNPERGPSVHPFYRGKAACALTDALEEGKRSPALVQDNLYVVSFRGNNGQKVGIIPKKFANLMPTMKASDYDYIIFDMPPVSQTSVTAKVCGLMDMTFLVVESERTKEEQAKRCVSLLGESRAKVAAVLNRYHNYLPSRLQTDI